MATPDFRSYFLIRIKLARTVNEIHGDLLSTFPDSCPGLSTLQRWHTEFDKGVFALEKKNRPGRPRETKTEENVARVKRLVEDNPRMTTRQVAAKVSLPSTTVFRLLTEDLGLRNLLSVLVPHQLSEANKTQRVKCCQDLLKLFQDHGEDFLGSHLLVQDESWFYWDSAEVRQVWAEPTGAHSEEDDDSDGVTCKPRRVSITALPAGTTADRNTMIEYLRTTGKRFLSLKKDKIRLKDCLLMWDNA
ncbi:Transposase, partial [Caligus rogercresseyi]